MPMPRKAAHQDSDSKPRRTRRSRPEPGHSKELCLRFTCPKCRGWLSVPLRTVGTKDTCPGCAKTITIPLLEGDIAGLDLVLKARGPTLPTWSIECPECGTHGCVDVAAAHNDFTCSSCKRKLRIDVVAVQPPAEAPTHATQPNGNAQPESTASQHCARPKPSEPAAEPSTEAWLAAAAEEPIAPPITTQLAQSLVSRGAQPWPIQRPALWISRGIYWGLFCLLLFGGTAVRSYPITFASFVWVVPRVGGLLSRFAATLLVDTVSCPRCQEVYQCTGIWGCSCGYRDHREQHLLRFTCPQCGGRIGQIHCERCESTILLW